MEVGNSLKKSKIVVEDQVERTKITRYSSSAYFYLSDSKFIANYIIVTVVKSASVCHGRVVL